jgi:hypothetical protein
MKHTPGPWRTLHAYDDRWSIGNPEQEDGSVCLVYGKANAHLIAAAPELLNALRTAAEALDAYSDVDDGPDGRPCANRAMSALIEIERLLDRFDGKED